MITAEIIAAGTELTSGQKLDTNSQWLASQLRDCGIDTRFHTCVGDAMEDNVSVIKVAAERCEVVLMTGGLGPTLDDITREAIATVVGQPLVLDDAALKDLEDLFRGRGREMPERNRTQAMRPRSAQILLNPHGTAPGLLVNYSRRDGSQSIIAAMPGVPSEMRPMFLEQVRPLLPVPDTLRRLRVVHSYGMGESAVEQILGDMTARNRNPEVGITASSATISLRILARGSTAEECEQLVSNDIDQINEKLGSAVFGYDEDTLQSVVVDRLANLRKTVATAESGSGGVILGLLSSAKGYSEVFNGGFTVPPAGDDELLGEGPPGNPFSADRAEHLAREVRTRLKADYGLAAVCDPIHLGTTVVPKDATAYVAIAGPNGTNSTKVHLLGNAAIHRPRIAKTALNMLRLELGACVN